MLRKVLTGAAALALPLTGLAVWGGTQVVSATPQKAATLHCATADMSAVTTNGELEFGAAPAANVKLATANTTQSSSSIDIIEPSLVTAGIPETETPAVVGQEVVINKQTDWITAVESASYYGTEVPTPASLGLPTTDSIDVLQLKNPIALVADNGTGNGVFPTSASPPTTYETIKLQATTAANVEEGVHGYTSFTGEGYDPPSVSDIGLAATTTETGCSLETDEAVSDFYPNQATSSWTQTYSSNAVTNFEGKTPGISAPVVWPASSGDYVNNANATLTFAPGSGIVCTSGAPDPTFYQDANGVYAPGTQPGDATACSLGQDLYLKGSMTGTYSGSKAVVALNLSGLVLCTYTEIVTDGDQPDQCYGGSLNGGSSEGSAVITDLVDIEAYDGTNGACDNATDSSVTFGGVTTPACGPPTGPDGSGIVGIGGAYEDGVINF